MAQRQPGVLKIATIGAERTLLTGMRRLLNSYLNVQGVIHACSKHEHCFETFEQAIIKYQRHEGTNT